MGDPTEEKQRARRPNLDYFKHGIGAFTAIGGFIGAVATLVALFSGLLGGGQSKTPGAKHPIVYKTVLDRADVLSLSVPSTWVARSEYVQAGVFGALFQGRSKRTSVGPGLSAASRFAANDDWKVDRAFIGVSTAAAAQLELPALTTERALQRLQSAVRDGDWTREGCELSGESRFTRSGLVGYYRRWTNCGQVGTFFWEVYAAPTDRRYVVVLQMQTQRLRDLPVLDHILQTFRVAPDRVPSA